MNTGTHYVVAAYGVMLASLLLYCVFASMRAGRIRREREVLARLIDGLPVNDTRELAGDADGPIPSGRDGRTGESR